MILSLPFVRPTCCENSNAFLIFTDTLFGSLLQIKCPGSLPNNHGISPTLVATTGQLQAIASLTILGDPSHSEVSNKRLDLFISSIISEWVLECITLNWTEQSVKSEQAFLARLKFFSFRAGFAANKITSTDVVVSFTDIGLTLFRSTPFGMTCALLIPMLFFIDSDLTIILFHQEKTQK